MSLRSAVIHLAHSRPELRGYLLPMLKTAEETELVAEEAILRQATGAATATKQAVGYLEDVVRRFPEDKKVAKVVADVKVLEERFKGEVAKSSARLEALSTKAAPKELRALAKKVTAGIEALLADSSQVKTFFAASSRSINRFVLDNTAYGTKRRLVLEQSYSQPPTFGFWLSGEHGNTLEPPYLGSPQWKPITSADAVIAAYREAARFWGFQLKGQSDPKSARETTVKTLVPVLERAAKGLGGGDYQEAEWPADFRSIEVTYRSDLPKEGAYDVGEDEYEGMVAKEMNRAKKALEPVLAPYRDQIAKTSLQDEEKGWINIIVTLK